jgi:CBS domain-containing protein
MRSADTPRFVAEREPAVRVQDDDEGRKTVTVEPTATIRQAANVLRRSIGCLVVVESSHVIGIVTASIA